jgi:hypothetical protein
MVTGTKDLHSLLISLQLYVLQLKYEYYVFYCLHTVLLNALLLRLHCINRLYSKYGN